MAQSPSFEESAVCAALRQRFGERFSTNAAIRDHHGRDESPFPAVPPEAVVFPESTEETAEVVRLCAAHRTPIVPFGTGTSLEGHVHAVRGGVCLDTSEMNRILSLNAEDQDCTVQAGVTRKRLNERVGQVGLFFPVDPGADASLGGMASTRASGTNAVRYGTMRENVLSLTCVLADGRIVRTGRRARKSSAGYDLTRLLIGSEGTLGVITELTLRLYGIPERIASAVCPFPSIRAAVDTVIELIQLGIPLARAELMDALSMKAVNAYSGLAYAEQPTLFFEFHGSAEGVDEQACTAEEIARLHEGGDFQWATKTEERNRLWEARHTAFLACLALRPGAKAITTDVCVPISRLTEVIEETRIDLEDSGLIAPILGHVGDGNFHAAILLDPDSEEEREKAHALNHRMVRRALAAEGTCTGEHGVGTGKMDFLEEEHGEALAMMRAIKQALDPMNIMNPGKMIRLPDPP